MIGTLPAGFTVIEMLPVPGAVPSETESEAERSALEAPPSVNTTVPSGL